VRGLQPIRKEKEMRSGNLSHKTSKGSRIEQGGGRGGSGGGHPLGALAMHRLVTSGSVPDSTFLTLNEKRIGQERRGRKKGEWGCRDMLHGGI